MYVCMYVCMKIHGSQGGVWHSLSPSGAVCLFFLYPNFALHDDEIINNKMDFTNR